MNPSHYLANRLLFASSLLFLHSPNDIACDISGLTAAQQRALTDQIRNVLVLVEKRLEATGRLPKKRSGVSALSDPAVANDLTSLQASLNELKTAAAGNPALVKSLDEFQSALRSLAALDTNLQTSTAAPPGLLATVLAGPERRPPEMTQQEAKGLIDEINRSALDFQNSAADADTSTAIPATGSTATPYEFTGSTPYLSTAPNTHSATVTNTLPAVTATPQFTSHTPQTLNPANTHRPATAGPSAAITTFNCAELHLSDGNYPDPAGRCVSHYFECFGGVTTSMACADPLVFSPITRACVQRHESLGCQAVAGAVTAAPIVQHPQPTWPQSGQQAPRIPNNAYLAPRLVTVQPIAPLPWAWTALPRAPAYAYRRSSFSCVNRENNVFVEDGDNLCTDYFFICRNGVRFRQACRPGPDLVFDPLTKNCLPRMQVPSCVNAQVPLAQHSPAGQQQQQQQLLSPHQQTPIVSASQSQFQPQGQSQVFVRQPPIGQQAAGFPQQQQSPQNIHQGPIIRQAPQRVLVSPQRGLQQRPLSQAQQQQQQFVPQNQQQLQRPVQKMQRSRGLRGGL